MNKAIIIGRLGRDPETRQTKNGPVCNLSVATSESWTDKGSGERREKTEWHRVTIWNEKLGEIAQKYLRKGSMVYLEGQVQTRKWIDQDEVEKYSTEIVLQRFRGELELLGDKQDGQREEPSIAPQQQQDQGDDLDDSIPF